MGCRVIFSLRSQRDLQRIVQTIARDNPRAAERFGMALIQQAELISRAPEMGLPMIERPGSRYLPFGRYLIIYRPETGGKVVRILRFWHGARGRRPLR